MAALTTLRKVSAVSLTVAAVLGAVGCSRAISGTAVAPAGAALLSTTCQEYVAMKQSSRREVIEAIGADGNRLVATNPEVWVGVAAALCTFTDPSTPVKDVVTGGMR